MIAVTMLALLGVGLAVLLAGGFVLMMAIKAIVWVVLLPFRLLFAVLGALLGGLLFLPLLLLKLVIGALFFVVVGPVLVIAFGAAAVAALVALAVPLLPLLGIAFVVWVVMRSSRPAVA